MSNLSELKNVYDDTAKIKVLIAQVEMLTDLIVITSQQDVKTALKKYIKAKEKELGI